MKRTFFAFLYFAVNAVCAQSPDAWINYSQSYYKIPVAADAIYRLSYTDLQQAGFPVDAVNPKNLQLIHRGVEQALHVAGEDDSRFDPSDFIEFYGRRNDGTLDASLYRPSSAQPHRFYNLYSDTTTYFLTIGSVPGKRMALISGSDPSGTVTPEYHLDEKRMILTEQYAGGVNSNDEIFTSSYDEGEGWTGALITQGGIRDYTITGITATLPAASVMPSIELMIVGRNAKETHDAQVYVGQSLRPLTTITSSGYAPAKVSLNLEWSDFSASGELRLQVRVPNTGVPDRVSLCYAIVRYPQQLDAGQSVQKLFHLPSNNLSGSYVTLSNTAINSRIFDITDPNNPIRLQHVQTSTLNVVLPFTEERELLCTSGYIKPAVLPVQFQAITPGSAEYVIVSHPALRTQAGGYADPVQAYADYRSSPDGGGYTTMVVNATTLNDQFNYGEHSPAAIFNFVKFMAQHSPPEYLFLIGKGLEVWYNANRNYSPTGYRDLIPTSGFPASDMFFSVGIGGGDHSPLIPTGRLSATTPLQVANYLNKIKEHEQVPFDQLWRKRLLHLSGGIEQGEPELFKGYLAELGDIAEGPFLGGHVSAIAKLSREIQLINIASQVNSGVNLITFFGHSSPSTLDFDIGFVSNPTMGYANKGKYPMLLMNGCQVGTFFLKDFLFGEDWVMAPDKGATGFIAHSSFGITSTLIQYSKHFYNVAYGDSTFLDKGVGDIQRETAKRYLDVNYPDLFNLAQIQQMILLGDPAVKLFGTRKVDLEVNANNIQVKSFHSNEPVTIQSDSFAIQFVVQNFGMASGKPFRVEILRTLNDNSTIAYDSIYEVPSYADTLVMVIRDRINGGGNNSFEVILDPDEIIGELNESNNRARIDFLIPSNGTKNIFPRPYGITNSREVMLSFQATDVLSGVRRFVVEVDTAANFSSDFRKSFLVEADVIGRQSIELLSSDTLPYYWRTRLADPTAEESNEWTTASFTFIAGESEGWAQVEFDQFTENNGYGIVHDKSLRRIRFDEKKTSIEVVTFGAAAGMPADAVSVKIDGQEFNLYSQAGGAFGCRQNSINLIAFDKKSTIPYVGVYLKWYELHSRMLCGREPFVINSFTSADVYTGRNDDIIRYVENIADGDSVLIYNIGDAGIYLWPAIARAKVGELGISEAQLASISPGAPFVIKAKKGAAPGTAQLFTSATLPENSARLEFKGSVTGGFSSGTFSTPTIGPATTWSKVVNSITEVNDSDQVSVDVVGIRINGVADTLLRDIAFDEDLASIAPEVYPMIRLVFHASDPLLLTPAQLSSWIVLYTPAPEGILLPHSSATRHQLQEGEMWNGDFRFINISDKHFSDSLSVVSEIFNQQRFQTSHQNFRIKPPEPGDTTEFSVNMSTIGKSGLNNFSLRVNPFILAEQFYDNNVFQRSNYIEVSGDNVSPVLDVSVDGRLLVNGDFVSASPTILVKLIDESPFNFKQDTVGMKIMLTYPCGGTECEPTYISLSRNDVQWSRATDSSPFTIRFLPEDLSPGKYFLKVEGEDANGNRVSKPYEISFVVTTESSLHILPPFPNPASDRISFGFNLAGGEVPESVSFIIYDYTGKSSATVEFVDTREFHVGLNQVEWVVPASFPNGIYLVDNIIIRNGKIFRKISKILIYR